MVQKVRVQDGVIVYTATEDEQQLEMGVRGSVTVTKTVTVGDDPNADSYIRTQGSGNLILTTALAGNLHLRTDTGSVMLNDVRWPDNRRPAVGTFLSVTSAGALSFTEFAIGVVARDNASAFDLNTQFPVASPGQVVLGPSVIYLCVNPAGSSSKWRRIPATIVS